MFSFSAASIPDGGATVALLGLSLAGIEGIRRKLMRKRAEMAFSFETRSLPTLPHRYPRDFTFYVTPPVAPFSFSAFSFQLFSHSPHNS